jgi:hypothetical protein
MIRLRSTGAPLGAIAVAFAANACAVRQADMTVISTRNVSLNRFDLDRAPHVDGVVGRDTVPVILLIPFGTPHLEDAIEDALTKGGGDVMVDAVVHQRGWTAILFGAQSVEVKGSVVKTRGVAQ